MQKVLLELNQLMGRRADTPLVVARADYDFPKTPDIGELMASALTNNYRMHIRRAELAQQGLHVSLARNERYPTIKIGPYFSQEEAGEREREAGIGLSLELPIFRNGRAKVDQAQARRMQAQATMHAAARELRPQVVVVGEGGPLAVTRSGVRARQRGPPRGVNPACVRARLL